MAYTINKTDGTVIATITDGTTDTSTSLTLFGKSFSGFGELLNENLVKLLENSAGTSAPTAPLKGEIWFDASTNQLKVYDGSNFKPSGGAKSSATAPTSPSVGDLWIDTDDDQLFVYSGNTRSHQTNSGWELVGPAFTAGQTQSGFVIETIASAGGNKVVASMFAGLERVCILSKETFTPSATITGFAEIKAGLTLNSTLGAVFDGTNTQANTLNTADTTNAASPASALQGGGNFMRTNKASTTTGAITIDTDTGLILGDDGELTVTVSSNDVTIAQTSQDKDLKFTVNDNGTTNTIMTLDGSETAINITGNVNITGQLNVSGEYNATSSNINTYDDAFIKLNNGNSETDSGMIIETSDTDDARLFYDVSENHFVAGQGASYSQIIRAADTTDDGAANHSTTLKSSSAGGLTLDSLTMNAVGSITEGDTTNKTVPTVGAVVTFGDLWGGSAKTVSTSDPSGGNDGDFWFKYA